MSDSHAPCILLPKRDPVSSSSVNALCSCPNAARHPKETPADLRPDARAHLPPNPSRAELQLLKITPSHPALQTPAKKAPAPARRLLGRLTPKEPARGCHVRGAAAGRAQHPVPGAPALRSSHRPRSLPTLACLCSGDCGGVHSKDRQRQLKES